MGASKDVFIKMMEDEYEAIPFDIRQRYLMSKNVTNVVNDYEENMKDEHYAMLYSEKKKATKALSEYEYYIREKRRKEQLKK